MTIGEALALGLGSVVTVGRLAGDPVDLLVNGRVIARGEVVAIEEELGLRITEIAAPVVDAPPPDSDDEIGESRTREGWGGRFHELKRWTFRPITGDGFEPTKSSVHPR